VIAIEKPGKDPSLAANYRPISLLSVCYKLLERLALQRISPTVKGLLSPDQACLTTFIDQGFQQKLKTGTIFLDLIIIIIIKTFITRKFAEAANVRSVDSTEEKRLQSLFEDVQRDVR